jgi:hypothetical protein
MRVQLRGRRYKLAFTKLRNKDFIGQCDAPSARGKRIVIDSGLQGQLRLDTIIHELLHGLYWELSEEAVDGAATDIAAVLWRLGYRGPSDGAS